MLCYKEKIELLDRVMARGHRSACRFVEFDGSVYWSWVVGRGSQVVGRGFQVVGRGSQVVGRGSQVVGRGFQVVGCGLLIGRYLH